jgi:arabinogalactan oligomer / maltooligosaccharide transport system substrate-binding protein
VKSNKRWLYALPAFALALSLVPAGGGGSLAQGDSVTFPETGKTVKGKFLQYWRSNGGLAQQGYPISEEMMDRSDTDGKIYTMQYFERAVFELHPENAGKPSEVLLSLLGNFQYKAKYGAAGAPNQRASTTNARRFAETGKTVGGRFREYWEQNGGLAQQGFPITDEFQERSELDGKTYTVQYFERAVFEAHPENQRPFDVLLSQLGTFELRKQAAAIDYPEGAGTITLWHGYTGSEAATLQKAVKMLTDKNANFKVNLLAVPFDQLQNKFTTEASTGGGPDLLIGPSDWVGGFAEAGLIAEMSGETVNALTAPLLASTLNVARYNNKLWGLPTSMKNVALYYNKSLVRTLPKNTDEMLTMAGSLATGNVQYGVAINAGFYHAVGYNFAFGGKLFNNPKQVDLTTPGTIAWLNWMKKAKESRGVFIKAGADDDINNLFKTGKAAMVINGPWALEDYEKSLGRDKVGVAIAPGTASGGKFAPFVGTENYYLNANKKDNKAALDFLAFISSPGVQSLFVREAGQISTNQKVDLSSNPALVPFVQQAAQGSVFPNFPAMGQVWTPAGDMITKVLDGKATPEQAAKEASDAINKAIAGGQ